MVMVHGVCSSAGCFSMTDEQIDDIYAMAREAFRGGNPKSSCSPLRST